MKLLAFAVLAACSSGTEPPPATPAGSAAPVAGPATVNTADEAKANLGKRVGVAGKAGNAKLGAVVVTEAHLIVYCEGVPEWPKDVADKQVMAHGTLNQDASHEAKQDPSGEVSQGTSGPVWSLKNCEYK
ncbi:MAG: hypothetical protein QM831_17035 [Kofleriaceae bacterium]